MNFTTKKLPKSELEIEVIIPFSEFELFVKKAATLLSEEVEVPGFRKGKAPYEVLKEKIGEPAIYERAADLAVRKTYAEVMKELVAGNKLSAANPPIGRPEITITKLAPSNELQYKVKLATLPEVKLPDYKEIGRRVREEKKEIAVSDEEIKDTLYWIRESRAKLTLVDRPAQKEDAVEVDFEVRQNGVKIENGASRNHPMVLGQGKFIPGFEEELLGMKTGDEKSFTLVAPESWHEKQLAGKALDFKVQMKLIQERQVAELNDEFAKGLGNFPNLEVVKTNIREGLAKEKEEKEKQRLRMLAIEKIAATAQVEPPEVLIKSELEKMVQELKSGVEQMGMQWEDYLLHIKKNIEDLKKEWQTEAEKRVSIALCLREIARQENIEVPEEEIKIAADKYLAQFENAEEAGKNIDPEELKEYTKGVLRNEKVFEWLESLT